MKRTEIIIKSMSKDRFLLVVVFSITFMLNLQISRNFNFFLADDWGWLKRAADSQGLGSFNLFPDWIYNDRPTGQFFIELEYFLFGLNFKAFQLTHLILHSLNTVLVFLISRQFLTKLGSVVSGLFFGLYLPANTAIFWPAAIFDLLGLNLILTAFILILQLKFKGNKNSLIWFATILIFLAVRTKELYIVAPFILLMFLWLKLKISFKEILRDYYLILIPSLLLGGMYLKLYLESRASAPKGDPYVISPISFFKNLQYYLGFFNPIGRLTPQVLIAFIVSVCLLGLFFRTYHKTNYRLITVLVVSFLLLLAPVLVLSAQQSALYLYAPHMMFGLIIGMFFDLHRKLAKFLLFLLLLVSYPILIHSERNVLAFTELKSAYVLDVWEVSKEWMDSLDEVDKVYISGLEPYFNPFSYGPGDSIKIYSGKNNLEVYVDLPDEELTRKFCTDTGKKLFITFENTESRITTSSSQAKCR